MDFQRAIIVSFPKCSPDMQGTPKDSRNPTMKNRREFLAAGLASLAIVATHTPEMKDAPGSGIETLSTYDLPHIDLNRWQASFHELTFPPGYRSPKHTHSGFVLGYVLEGKFRLHIEGRPETLLSAGETFYEAPGAIHLPSGSASATESARVLVAAFGEKGKEWTKLL